MRGVFDHNESYFVINLIWK